MLAHHGGQGGARPHFAGGHTGRHVGGGGGGRRGRR
jgi:hypothetical protein